MPLRAENGSVSGSSVRQAVPPTVAEGSAPECGTSYIWSAVLLEVPLEDGISLTLKSKMEMDFLCTEEQFSRSFLKEAPRAAVRLSLLFQCLLQQCNVPR